MSDGGDFLDSDQLVNSYKRQLLEDQQAQKPKAAACISKMRAIKGTARVKRPDIMQMYQQVF